MKPIIVKWKDRRGNKYSRTYHSADEAAARETYLNEQETLTMRVAPTDSGDTRFNYLRESEAIREALGVPIYPEFQHHKNTYRLVLWDGGINPRHVLDCSDARGDMGARLYLFACVPFRLLRKMEPRRLDQVLFGFQAVTQ